MVGIYSQIKAMRKIPVLMAFCFSHPLKKEVK